MAAVTSACGLAPRGESAAARRQRRIEAFHPNYRRPIADLTYCVPNLEDLADSFPALLFALVTNYGTPARRKRACDLVSAGAPLREGADVLGIGWWLRKLPPYAFVAPLPAFSNDQDFGFRISGLVPRDYRIAQAWLARIAHAYEACDAPYAVWLARQNGLIAYGDEFSMFMAAWAWFSGHEGHLGYTLLRKPWHSEMSLRRAHEELSVWRQRLRLIEYLGPGIETPWLLDGTAAGYNFVALRTVNDFVAESEALDNCLDQYAEQLRTGATAVFSIRRNERRIACVEIGLHETEATMPTIVQLKAARNRRAPPEVWQATFAWLGGQRLEPLPPARHTPKPARRMAARQKLWEPYLAFLADTPHHQPFRRTVMSRLPSWGTSSAGRSVPRQRTADLHLRLRAVGERMADPPLEQAPRDRGQP